MTPRFSDTIKSMPGSLYLLSWPNLLTMMPVPVADPELVTIPSCSVLFYGFTPLSDVPQKPAVREITLEAGPRN